MEPITVECHAGSRSEEYPLRFFIHGRRIEIKRIVDRWLNPGYRCFKVKGDDGTFYVLQYDENNDSWNLKTTD